MTVYHRLVRPDDTTYHGLYRYRWYTRRHGDDAWTCADEVYAASIDAARSIVDVGRDTEREWSTEE